MNTNKMVRRIGRLVSLLVLVAMVFSAAGASAAPNRNTSEPPKNPPPQKHVTTPLEFFGYNLGDDYKLTPWMSHVLPNEGFRKGFVDYMYELQRTSNRVRVFPNGKSSGGLPMLLTVITSPENWARMDHLLGISTRLQDPRGLTDAQALELAEAGIPTYWVNGCIHASERTALETETRLAYEMASNQDAWTKNVLDNMILVIEGSNNPDGVELVTDWYYKYFGTPYANSSPPKYNLYNGHDDNRDWIGLALNESQNSAGARFKWNPVTYTDLHQARDLLYMGASPDPNNIGYPAIAIGEYYGLNMYVIAEMTAAGYKGVFTWDYADMWNPAFNAMFTVMHNGTGGSWELTGVSGATPVTITSGGNVGKLAWWNPAPYSVPFRYHLIDAMNMQGDAVKFSFNYVTRNKADWLYNMYMKAKQGMAQATGTAPFAYVIPANGGNNANVTELLNTLVVDQKVEVHQAAAAFTADGQTFAKGDYVVRLDQPYGMIAKSLLMRQDYPINRVMNPYNNSSMVIGAGSSYDQYAWTLGLMAGVKVVGLNTPLPSDLKLTLVKRAVPFAGSLVGGVSKTYVLQNDANFNLAVVLPRLWKDKDMSVSQVDAAFTAGGRTFPAGTFVVGTKGTWWNHFSLKALVEKWGLTAFSISSAEAPPSVPLHQPKVGIYKPNVTDDLEGWARLRFDRAGFPYTSLPWNLSGVNLSDYDVILIIGLSASSVISGSTSSSFPADLRGGIGLPGVAALKSWVEAGGTLALMSTSASFPLASNVNWNLGVAAGPGPTPKAQGDIVRTLVNPTTKVGYGYGPTDSIFYIAGSGSPYFTVTNALTATVVASYPNDGATILQSGYISGENVLRGQASIVDASMGAGHVVMIGNDVVYRNLATSDYNFMWNAVLEGARPH